MPARTVIAAYIIDRHECHRMLVRHENNFISLHRVLCGGHVLRCRRFVRRDSMCAHLTSFIHFCSHGCGASGPRPWHIVVLTCRYEKSTNRLLPRWLVYDVTVAMRTCRHSAHNRSAKAWLTRKTYLAISPVGSELNTHDCYFGARSL